MNFAVFVIVVFAVSSELFASSAIVNSSGDVVLGIAIESSESPMFSPLSQQDMSLSLVLDRVDLVLGIVSSELSVFSTLYTSNISSSPTMSCSGDVVLGIVIESSESTMFSPLSQPDISTPLVPGMVGDVGLGNGKESTELPK